jgi:hypothetical protein
MNPLRRALIEKTGHDNGFEHVLPVADAIVTLALGASPRQRHGGVVVQRF